MITQRLVPHPEALADIERGRAQLHADRITVGMATCGRSAGAEAVMQKLKAADLGILLEEVGCLGMCHQEPIVMVRQNSIVSIYAKVTPDKIDSLIAAIKENRVHAELLIGHELSDIDFFRKQMRLLMDNCGIINPLSLSQYLSRGGYQGLRNAVSKSPKEVVQDIKLSGLRGRGGAGFPTGTKWEILASKEGRRILICNGDAGDPGAFMNRIVFESDPYKLLEGMTIAGYATGAKEGIIYTRAEYPLAIETLGKAIPILEQNSLLGESILGIPGFDFTITIRKGAGAFVCGEETALIASVMGRRGNPRFRPPYPAEKGVYGVPTNINNVSTLSLATCIMRIGAAEFAKIGTQKTTGTAMICLAGKIKKTGVVEVPMGTTVRTLVFDIGGGCSEGEFKALQCGGPSGGCLNAAELDLPIDFESIQSAGAIMGSGGMIVLSTESCMVDVAKFFMSFTTAESCGKCVPCREGNKRMWEILDRITKGLGTRADLDKLKQLAGYVKENSLCGLGQGAPNPVLSTLSKFMDEYLAHVDHKTCPSKACKNLVTYTILDNCVGCGNCTRHCPVNCIAGKLKEKHVIDQSLCVRCGACYESCAFDAILRK